MEFHSIGTPFLTSNNGLLIYNMTKIGQVSAQRTTFSWNLKSNNHDIEIKDGYKVAVTAINNHGCFGSEGQFIIKSILSDVKVANNNIVSD